MNTTDSNYNRWNESSLLDVQFAKVKATCLTIAHKTTVTAALIVSIICIIITMTIYILISEVKTLHGKVLLSLSGCLCIGYILLIFDMYLKPVVSTVVCQGFSILTYMALLSSFFWTNVMTYDIWKSISALKRRSNASQMKNYLQFSVYAWSLSLIITIILVILGTASVLKSHFQPKIIGVICWLSGSQTAFFFQSLPIGTILLCNLIFFILTTKKLREVKNDTAILQLRNDRQWYQLYIKLFLSFGLIWLTVFIPLIFDMATEAMDLDLNSCSIHLVTNVVNSLHGVFLFLIFVCKKTIHQRLQIRYNGYNVGFSNSEKPSEQIVALRHVPSNNNLTTQFNVA